MAVSTRSLTDSQLERRERILTACVELATEGGWEAVQMREVASRAEVALGTLYRYFPSKEHLLLSLMLDQVRALADRLSVRPPSGDDRVSRINDVLRRANRSLQSQPEVTTAMIRALVSGNTDVAPVVTLVVEEMRRIITDAMADEGPLDEERRIRIDLLSDVWLSALVGWISGAQEIESVLPHLAEAARVLLG